MRLICLDLYPFNWIVLFLIYSFLSPLYILDIRPLSDVELIKKYSPFCRLSFVRLMVSFAFQKFSVSQRSHLLVVNLSICIISVLFRRLSAVLLHSKLFSTLSSVWFNVFSGLILRSLIYLEFFVQGDKYASICILIHREIQFDQRHLLEMFSVFQCPWVYELLSLSFI